MSNHTPEPWVSDGSKVEGDCPAYRQDIAYCPTFLHNQTYGEANAARIVACVNACRGLDVAKVAALLDACRAWAEYDEDVNEPGDFSELSGRVSSAEDALIDSIRAGGGQC